MDKAQKLVSNWNVTKLYYLYLFIGIVCLSVIGLIFINRITVTDTIIGGTVASSSESLESDEEAVVVDVKPVFKSQEAKDLVVQEDLEYMSSLGLYYDYAKLSLEDTVKAFLIEQGLSPSQVAFTYKNLVTNEVFSMNDSQPMTAGSTYKLPLNMLVVDAVEEGKVSATESYDITGLTYEYKPEHDAYVENYNGKMTIADMQYGSIVVSENTPAYALADRIGGMDKAYSHFNRYGVSNNLEVPTFSISDNKTTTSYYTHVLDYLYQHQDKYADLLYYLDLAFPGLWLEQYVHGVTIYQKPGYVREALNIDAIVMEETPYSIALYTSYFGNASEDDIEIDAVGYNQVTALAYVINEWHRVNMNPARETVE
ncbi:TPA: serine hydrolase [Streptococcus suis]|nr:serine hydrolase [Streptococcus suis]HEM2547752.1 serine hydrolase [Streptococcus suis]